MIVAELFKDLESYKGQEIMVVPVGEGVVTEAWETRPGHYILMLDGIPHGALSNHAVFMVKKGTHA